MAVCTLLALPRLTALPPLCCRHGTKRKSDSKEVVVTPQGTAALYNSPWHRFATSSDGSPVSLLVGPTLTFQGGDGGVNLMYVE